MNCSHDSMALLQGTMREAGKTGQEMLAVTYTKESSGPCPELSTNLFICGAGTPWSLPAVRVATPGGPSERLSSDFRPCSAHPSVVFCAGYDWERRDGNTWCITHSLLLTLETLQAHPPWEPRRLGLSPKPDPRPVRRDHRPPGGPPPLPLFSPHLVYHFATLDVPFS